MSCGCNCPCVSPVREAAVLRLALKLACSDRYGGTARGEAAAEIYVDMAAHRLACTRSTDDTRGDR